MPGQSIIEKERLAAEAAEWFVRVNQRQAPLAVRQDFVDWMLRSSAHLEAYLIVAQIGAEVSTLAELPSRNDLIAAAKASDPRQNVVELRSIQRRSRNTVTCRRRVNRKPSFRLATAASVAFALLLLGGLVLQFSQGRTHLRTQIGEQRSIVLEDGSTVLINTASDMSVSFSEGERLIALHRGEARFTVARNSSRPFVVITPQATVRALGTVFNVHIAEENTEVSVFEGHVNIIQRNESGGLKLFPFGNKPTSPGKAQDLRVSEQATVPAVGAIQSGRIEPSSNALAWPRHQISFHDKTIADLVTEFNRYHRQPMRIADPELAHHEVDGTFDAYDHDSLLSYLERYQDVSVARKPDGSIVLQRKR